MSRRTPTPIPPKPESRPVGRPSNTEARRAQIVDAFMSVMARTGYEHATVAAIAREARLLPGLIHYHFENKHEILIALLEGLVERRNRRLAARLATAGTDPRARLFAFIDAHVALGSDADPRAVAAWVVVGAEAVRQPEVRALYRDALAAALDEVREIIHACLATEGRTTRHAGRISAAVISAIEGAYLLHASAPGLLPEGYAAPTLRRMVEGLLGAEPAS
jgi:TetR/AcrR family transcriptional repressor of bet genes